MALEVKMKKFAILSAVSVSALFCALTIFIFIYLSSDVIYDLKKGHIKEYLLLLMVFMPEIFISIFSFLSLIEIKYFRKNFIYFILLILLPVAGEFFVILFLFTWVNSLFFILLLLVFMLSFLIFLRRKTL